MSAWDQTLWPVLKRTAKGALLVVIALVVVAAVLVISFQLGGLLCPFGSEINNEHRGPDLLFGHTILGLMCLFLGAGLLRLCYFLGDW
ncbi:hypothetical protein RMR16_026890 (plasmid) [Agrobacterium sp. rho-13.3]|uniref:hypothetical protein n=1 Tax=Agrobacterium sp. rho-13.3 TaxID=3072980 RepID=UPI002A16D9B7|nr:hypothetical protein [Agrobacterium sp. rho-13.3]MDX8311567.1 hypothetical protein [Agrobacterium sp. rho-13.3]